MQDPVPCSEPPKRSRLRPAFFVFLAAWISGPSDVLAQEAGTLALLLHGRVVDDQTKEPLAGAEVRIHRSLLCSDPENYPPWVRDEVLKTDSQGRIRINFPAEQVSQRDCFVTLSLESPGYTPLQTDNFSLWCLGFQRTVGGRPTLGTIGMKPRRSYTANVETPDGKPAANVPYKIRYLTCDNAPLRFCPRICEGRTDDAGRIDTWMPPKSCRIELMPEDYAPLQADWSDGVVEPEPVAPPSRHFGDFTLQAGRRVTGKLLDLKGRPIGHQHLEIREGYIELIREAETKEDGTFSFAPLAPNVYRVHAARQFEIWSDRPGLPIPDSTPLIMPTFVYLRENEDPPPVLLRESPSVVVETKVLDNNHRPITSGPITIWGTVSKPPDFTKMYLPRDVFHLNKRDLQDADLPFGEPEWSAVQRVGKDGMATFRVPFGLRFKMIGTSNFNHFLPVSDPRIRFSGDKDDVNLRPDRLPPVIAAPRVIELVYDPAPRFESSSIRRKLVRCPGTSAFIFANPIPAEEATLDIRPSVGKKIFLLRIPLRMAIIASLVSNRRSITRFLRHDSTFNLEIHERLSSRSAENDDEAWVCDRR